MSALFTKICYGENMKKLVSYIFVFLMFFSVGFAEIYACSAELSRFDREGEVETTIFTRKGIFFYNELNMKFKIHKESDDEIHLVQINNTASIYAIIINKKTKEYAENFMSIKNHRENVSKPLMFGKCVKG